MERDSRRGLGLMIGFIGLYDTVHDYTLHFTVIHRHTHTSVQSRLHRRCLVEASNSAKVPLSLGFRTVPGLT
jgi:hypothetical protein